MAARPDPAGPSLTLTALRILPEFGSDHRPYLAELCFNAAAASWQSPPPMRSSNVEDARSAVLSGQGTADYTVTHPSRPGEGHPGEGHPGQGWSGARRSALERQRACSVAGSGTARPTRRSAVVGAALRQRPNERAETGYGQRFSSPRPRYRCVARHRRGAGARAGSARP